MLFDNEMRWQFTNRQLVDFQRVSGRYGEAGISAWQVPRVSGAARRFRSRFAESEINRRGQSAASRSNAAAARATRRRTASGKYVEFNFKPLGGRQRARHLPRHHGTEVSVRKPSRRPRSWPKPPAPRAESSRLDAVRSRSVLQKILENMTDGVALVSPRSQLEFINDRYANSRNTRATSSTRRLDARHREIPGPARRFQPRRSRRRGRTPDASADAAQGARYERLAISGRYIEINFRPLDDGSKLIVHRDITELETPRGSARRRQGGADAARRDVERGRAVMQVVLDNMNDGVMLLGEDKTLRIR
jgi:hypothetical protein